MADYERDDEYEACIAQLIANREQAASLARPPQRTGVPPRTGAPCRPPLNTLSVSRTSSRTPRCGFPANVHDDFLSSDAKAAADAPADVQAVPPSPLQSQASARKRPINDTFPQSAEDDWRRKA